MNPPLPSPGVPAAAPAPAGPARGYARFWLTFAAVVIADQASKEWVLRTVPPNTYWDPPPIPVVDGFFNIVHIYNEGAAWGMFSGFSAWLGWLGVAALAAIFFFRRHLELHRPLLQYAFGMLCAGILGNLIDRVRLGHVVDFLDFHLPWGYRYPAFNIADSGITVGVVIYFIYSICDWRNQPGAKP